MERFIVDGIVERKAHWLIFDTLLNDALLIVLIEYLGIEIDRRAIDALCKNTDALGPVVARSAGVGTDKTNIIEEPRLRNSVPILAIETEVTRSCMRVPEHC
ncbi:hypothetical protein D3C86_1390390 [compost metagenome]